MKQKIKYILILVAIFLVVDIGRYIFYPNINELKKINPIPTAFMEYRMEQWKDEGLDKKITQKWVKLKNISPYLIKAVLISEDDKFWKHDGFDSEALESAFEKNLKAGKFGFGGSTVSQQLSKNLYLSPSKNPIRKIKEAIITYKIEQTLSKKRIIEIYLNIAEWGDGIFGIEAASRHYFKKSAKNLTAMEASKLASVLPNPIIYNPLGKQKFVVKKSNRLYKIMLQRGIIIPDFVEVMKVETFQNGDNNDSLDSKNESIDENIDVELKETEKLLDSNLPTDEKLNPHQIELNVTN
jgi:monofunctional glycosyltransferase